MEVTVLNRQRSHPVNRQEMIRFLQRLIEVLPSERAASVAVCLVSDRRMIEFNRRYRGRRATTDVLSFPANDTSDPDGGCHLGDILISVPRARLQASQVGHSLARELKTLVVHGYLHLLGYDHQTDDGTMMRLQRRLVRRLIGPRRRGGHR